jgi:hypothetical protein
MVKRNAIDQNKKGRAKPPARRGCNAYASESDTTNRHSSFVNHQFCSGSDGTEPAYTDLEVFQDLQKFLLAEIRP